MIVQHYDIQAAFLNGKLTHEVYMRQPEGYAERADYVCKLNKSLYGLKQGANEWNKKVHNILTANEFKRSKNDRCLYSKCEDAQWMYLSVHVDDMVVAASSDLMIRTFDSQMNEVIVMKDLGNLQYYLGIQNESRAVPNSGCVVFGRIRIIDATIRPNTNRIRIVEVRDVKLVFFLNSNFDG